MLTGAAKLPSAFWGAQILKVRDPLLGVETQTLMMVAGMAEIALCVVLLLWRDDLARAWLLFVVGLEFALYHLCLLFTGWTHPCGCLGSLHGWLGLTPKSGNAISLALAICLAVCGLGLWINDGMRRQPAPNAQT